MLVYQRVMFINELFGNLSQAQITIINVLLMLAARWFGEREVHLTKCGNSAGGTRYSGNV
jgi:hypothetical protein